MASLRDETTGYYEVRCRECAFVSERIEWSRAGFRLASEAAGEHFDVCDVLEPGVLHSPSTVSRPSAAWLRGEERAWWQHDAKPWRGVGVIREVESAFIAQIGRAS